MWKVIIAACTSLVVTAPVDDRVDFSPINQFALRLLDNAYAFQENFGRQNFAVSPLSVWSVFSLLAEGSAGDTFQELMKELQLPQDLRATQELHLAAESILRSNDPDLVIHKQAALFPECSLEIHQEFCQAANMYRTGVYSVDITNTTRLADDINYYICVATEGQIRNAVKEEFLRDLRLLIVDALYFKANWTHPFDPTATREEDFYNGQGKTIGRVNMMFHKASHNIGDSNSIGAQILEMTYGKHEEFSMLILLPFEGMPLKTLLSNLVKSPLDWITDFKRDDKRPEIDVFIPRFKVSSQIDLIPALKYTGIHTIFDSEKAQLPGISDSPLFVSKTIQNVEIDVREEGTVAAAATVVGLENRFLSQRFEANKEFVFMITHRKSNVILFAGVYSDPAVV
ncbi:serine protease inhibitor-like [Cydia fagiglandana]|uniref:serine protease inhibitor-like n=1 Tax=Cydia fagiglandana TaxID=1458189 RepID=UPI002FEE285C